MLKVKSHLDICEYIAVTSEEDGSVLETLIAFC